MKAITTITILCLTLAIVTTTFANELPLAFKSDLTSELSLKERMIHRRGIEAAVWSMPLMNFKAMRDALKKAGAGFNDVAYFSQIQDWKFQIATPNNTTPYVTIFWNVKEGPVVVDIPASVKGVGIFGTLMDAWQRPLEDVGAKGKDGGRGARYLILPPGFQGEIPNGYIPLNQKTYNGFGLLRPIISSGSEENLKKAVAFVKKIQVYPLAKASNPPKTQHVDIYGKLVDAIVTFDADFYKELHEIIQEEVIEERDYAVMGQIKALGITKGSVYKPNKRRNEILHDAAKEAQAYLIEQYHDSLIPPYYEGRQWTNAATPGVGKHGFNWGLPGYIDIDNRGALYYAVCTSVKNFGTASYYLSNAKDKDGDWLYGGRSYKFNVPANVPVKDFWSVIAYDMERAAWIQNQPKVGVASSDHGLEINKDGSVDVYFGPKAPSGKEANWVPTSAGKKFFLLFRFYGPEAAVFTKTWQLNDFEKF